MKHSFPNPMPIEALLAFCHPWDGHLLSQPRRGDGEVLAANGYIAIRAKKGWWLESDFQPAGEEYRKRFDKLPWARFERLGDHWRPLDNVRGDLFRSGKIEPWLRHRPAPTPLWLFNSRLRVRLSHLQLVAMLPRCEAFTGTDDRDDPLFFRFTGGIGIMARDAKLQQLPFSRQIFPQPAQGYAKF